MIKVLGSKSCGRCDMIKTILNNRGVIYDYLLLEDISDLERNKYMDMAVTKGHRTMPLILKDEILISLEEV